MKKTLFFLAAILMFIACKNETKSDQLGDGGRGAEIMDTVVQKAGSDKLEASIVNFNFRDLHYRSERNCGQYSLERIAINNQNNHNDTIIDKLQNMGFSRTINGVEVPLEDSLKVNYGNSVNSVHYFLELPFGLNDPMVKKNFLKEATLKNKTYYLVEVSFDEDLPESDHQDEYLYWVNKNDYTIDYLAYQYGEGDKKGIRFREAYNPRTVEGIRFVDYKNYKPKSTDVKLEELGALHEKQALELVSEIETNNIKIDIKKKNCM